MDKKGIVIKGGKRMKVYGIEEGKMKIRNVEDGEVKVK